MLSIKFLQEEIENSTSILMTNIIRRLDLGNLISIKSRTNGHSFCVQFKEKPPVLQVVRLFSLNILTSFQRLRLVNRKCREGTAPKNHYLRGKCCVTRNH